MLFKTNPSLLIQDFICIYIITISALQVKVIIYLLRFILYLFIFNCVNTFLKSKSIKLIIPRRYSLLLIVNVSKKNIIEILFPTKFTSLKSILCYATLGRFLVQCQGGAGGQGKERLVIYSTQKTVHRSCSTKNLKHQPGAELFLE